MKLSIIIPVFNEEKTIEQVLTNVINVHLPRVQKEIIVVNDGSTDNTKKILKNIKNQLKVVHHEKNAGKGAAVRTGITHATGEYIVIQDADLEYNPKDIQLLLDVQRQKNAHVVYGSRLKRLPHLKKEERTPLFLLHYFGNRFLSLITSILYGSWITDMETCYKLFPRDAVKDMKLRARGFEFEPEITAKLLKRGHKIVEHPITATPRGYNEGKKLNTIKDGTKALVTLVKYRITD